jgi:two-component system phosphate regulon response regulator PhoB
VEAHDGETGLDLVESEKPDMILLDWVLPGLSGPNFFKQLQRRSEYRSIPIIIVSARGEELTRTTAQGLGAAGYLVKPFDINDLRATVARVADKF